MKKSHIFLICGRSSSGKGTLARYIQEQHDALVYHFSEPLHAILSDLNVPNTRANLAKLSLSLRKNFGEHILGLGAREYIEKNRGKLIVLEGIRRVESLKDWEDQIDHIIWIDTKPEIRYSRMLSRGEKSAEGTLTYADFLRQEALETEQSLERLRGIATYLVENNETMKDFYETIDAILNVRAKY